jgi:hypothetical protein
LILAALLALTVQPQSGQIDVWRKLDAQGRACASCHSPDGLELSVFNFGRTDVLRRASKHLAADDQLAIFAFLNRKAVESLQPMLDRPLQPGGSPLPGKTAADRDLAFGTNLVRLVPGLTQPVKDLEGAKRLRDQLLSIDLRTLPVGFFLNRLSEDRFHGEEHATIAQWIPDLPVANSPELFRLQDAYLADPNIETLSALDSATVAANPITQGLADLSLQKYRSLLMLNYRLRTNDRSRIVLGRGNQANPMWQVGDLARQYAGADARMMGAPHEVALAKTVLWSKQLKDMQIPWFWLGWTEDPGLSRSGLVPETMTGHYFVTSLLDNGPYPIHAAFVVARRMVELGYGQNSWNSPMPRHPELQFSAFAVSHRLTGLEIQNPAQKVLFRLILTNTFRMMTLLVADDARRSGAAIHRESQAGQARYLATYLKLDASDVLRALAQARAEIPTRH